MEACTSISDAEPIDVLVSTFGSGPNTTREDYLHVGLAPSDGVLGGGSSMKVMDDELLLMIAATIKDLENLAPSERSWEAIVALFMQNPLLEPAGEAIIRSSSYVTQSISRLELHQAPDASIAQEILTWFAQLIQDSDVLESTAIDISVMAEVVAKSEAAIKKFAGIDIAVTGKKEKISKDIVDIGVLRFPDMNHDSYYKVYRIRLFAWSQSQSDSNGIAVEFWSRSFKPNEVVMDQLDAKTKQKAIAEAKKKLDLDAE